MDSRQQFEEWASDNGKWPQAVERNGDSYKFMKTHTDWLAWKASRESLVINLPVMPKAQRSDAEATFSAGGCDMLSKCIKSIEAAGLKVTQ